MKRSFVPISRDELELIDENTGWIPGALVRAKNPMPGAVPEPDGSSGWNSGFGLIIAVYNDGEGVSVLWTTRPGWWNRGHLSSGYVFAPYVPLVSTPTIHQRDFDAAKARIFKKKLDAKGFKVNKDFFGTVKVKDIK